MTEPLLTQKEAAAYLRVSVAYLRRSSCPKVLLPSSKLGGKPLVRYELADVKVWKEARRLKKAG
jgi:hypothetical protein